MAPLVSIIVPFYNASAFIERCARSILEQDYENIECFFVNDCSTDNSVDILNNIIEGYSNRNAKTQIINLDVNQGHAHARNVGLNRCVGKYVIQFDADDWIEKDMVSSLVNKAEAEDADITCSGYVIENPNHSKIVHIDSSCVGRDGIKKSVIGLVVYAHWNKLIKLSLIRENNIYCIDGVNNWVDIGQICPLLLMAGKTAIVDKPLYHYNACNINSVSRNMTDRRIKNMITVAGVVSKFVNEHSDGEFMLQMEFLKFMSKRGYIAVKRNDYDSWRRTYPETSKHIWTYPISLIHKVCYWLAVNNVEWPCELAKAVKQMIDKRHGMDESGCSK